MDLQFWIKAWQDEEAPEFWNGELPVPPEGKFLLVTCGASKEEVLARAVELADEWVRHCWEQGLDVDQRLECVVGMYPVSPSLPVRASWLIRKMRQDAGLTQAQASERVRMNQQAYSRLENPSKSNATVKTFEKIAKALGKRVEVVIR